jgi:asparagine synthase (glutamine-hydrolysing)
MCGIGGQFNFISGRPVEPTTIARMNRTLVHRGPDSGGSYISGALGMGVRRLAIIDVMGGDQPIWNEDDMLAVTCNGEIYNAPELTQVLEAQGHTFRTGSDVEVILHLYEEYGEQCATHLNGMFAFALWDQRQCQLLLGRDLFGIKPLYYHIGREGLVWASELPALLTAGVEAEMDPNGIWDYLAYWYVPEPGTPLRDVWKLPPGQVLIANQAGVQVRRFADLPVPVAQSMPLEEASALSR